MKSSTEPSIGFSKKLKTRQNLTEFLFSFYKLFLNPIFGNACCYYPSCSQYARESFHYHHPLKAFGLSLWRLLRCHPFSRGGFDPVPLPGELKREQ